MMQAKALPKPASEPASEKEALARMSAYKEMDDRSAPPVFSGRGEQLQWLAGRVDAVGRGALGMTSVVHGVPGMGKTALGDEFARHKKGSGKGAGSAFCVKVTPGDLDAAPIELMHDITRSLAASGWGQMGRVRERLNEMGSLAMLLKYDKAGQDLFDRPRNLHAGSPMKKCLRSYANDLWGEDATVVLLIDEMQNCPVTDRTRDALGVLHNGEFAKVLPVCLGLPNTGERLAAIGLSRLSKRSERELRCLAEGPAREVIDGTIAWLGFEQVARGNATDREWEAWRGALSSGLAARSGGFPQHLTLGLMTACESVLAVPLRDRLGKNVLEKAAQIHEREKLEYYQARVRNAGARAHTPALGALAMLARQEMDERLPYDEALDFLSTEWGAQDAEEVLKEAVRQGLAGEADDAKGGVSVTPPPIPSMETYLRDRFKNALHRRNAKAVAANEAHNLMP